MTLEKHILKETAKKLGIPYARYRKYFSQRDKQYIYDLTKPGYSWMRDLRDCILLNGTKEQRDRWAKLIMEDLRERGFECQYTYESVKLIVNHISQKEADGMVREIGKKLL